MTNELPQITASNLVATSYAGGLQGLALENPARQWDNANWADRFNRIEPEILRQLSTVKTKPAKEDDEDMADYTRRIAKVYIVDPDENVPLDKCLLHEGEETLTELTDEELFFEIDIKKILEEHNKERAKLYDKSVKERKEHLEPARIRDLRMTVVTVAAF